VKGDKPFTVYNLTVADDHTYFAGDLDGGLWAHNSCASNAKILRTRLEADKFIAAANDAAHHIVPSGDYRGANSRAILNAEGIDINDADNGVFLDKSIHSSIHTGAYYRAIENELQNAPPGTIRSVLQSIRQRILQGQFP
jgi:hypothetical protein